MLWPAALSRLADAHGPWLRGHQGVGEHLLEGDLATSELAEGLHLGDGHPVIPPLRDGRVSNPEVKGDGFGPALLLVQPFGEFHAPSLEHFKRRSQATSKPLGHSIGSPMQNPRRQRFIEWYRLTYPEGAEGRKQFMKDTTRSGEDPITKGRVSQLFDEEQQFGETAAKTLAVRLGKPEDFFLPKESAEGNIPNLDEEARRFAVAYQKMSPEQRASMHLFFHIAEAGHDPEKIRAAIVGDASEPVDTFQGGESGLMGLDEAKPTKKKGEQQ